MDGAWRPPHACDMAGSVTLRGGDHSSGRTAKSSADRRSASASSWWRRASASQRRNAVAVPAAVGDEQQVDVLVDAGRRRRRRRCRRRGPGAGDRPRRARRRAPADRDAGRPARRRGAGRRCRARSAAWQSTSYTGATRARIATEPGPRWSTAAPGSVDRASSSTHGLASTGTGRVVAGDRRVDARRRARCASCRSRSTRSAGRRPRRGRCRRSWSSRSRAPRSGRSPRRTIRRRVRSARRRRPSASLHDRVVAGEPAGPACDERALTTMLTKCLWSNSKGVECAGRRDTDAVADEARADAVPHAAERSTARDHGDVPVHRHRGVDASGGRSRRRWPTSSKRHFDVLRRGGRRRRRRGVRHAR